MNRFVGAFQCEITKTTRKEETNFTLRNARRSENQDGGQVRRPRHDGDHWGLILARKAPSWYGLSALVKKFSGLQMGISKKLFTMKMG
jgi:hypothetical protein